MLDQNKVKLAIAPIGWTNDDMPDLGGENTFEQCVSEMALAGFKGSEIGNKYPKDVAVLKHKLDVRGLTICNAWFSTLFISEPFEVTKKNFIEHRDRLYVLGARVIGVNNRNLKNFTVDTSNALSLREYIPSDRIFVAESGITTAQSGAALFKGGADALLIGEALMRCENKRDFISELKAYAD